MAVAGLGLSLAIALIGICVVLTFGSGQVESRDGRVSVQSHVPANPSKGSTSTGTRVRPTEPRGDGTETKSDSETDFTYSSTNSDGPTVPGELWLIAAGLLGALIGLLLPTPQGLSLPTSRQEPGGWIVASLVFVAAAAIVVLGSIALQGVLAAAVAAAVALLIPTPARYDPN